MMANQTWRPCFVKVIIVAADHRTDKSYTKLKSEAKILQIYPYT